MTRTGFGFAALSAAVAIAGCSAQQTRVEMTPVAVRFMTPPDTATFTGSGVATARYDETGYTGLADRSQLSNTTSTDAFHVALWGGPFNGHDVTYAVTSLPAGSYTFAFVDHADDEMLQGWLAVQHEGRDFLGYLNKWKDSIPELKQQLAYDFEITGQLEKMDPEAFKNFQQQVRAIEELEKELNQAIAAEMRAQQRRQGRMRDVFNSAQVRVFPGGEEVFRPATDPAFTEADLASVQPDGSMTKIVVVADYDDARGKLTQVSSLYNDLQRCRAVAQQEADRLERRKGLFLLTDHLHDHDRRFVENEVRLQNTLGLIERINDKLGELRQRRLALAYMCELVAPEHRFAALDREAENFRHERAVLETELQRINTLFNEASEDSARRVALERSRQRVTQAINDIDRQLTDLGEARMAMANMVNSSRVIHREGDARVMAATFLKDDLPFYVRRAVEDEAVMTIRVEARDEVFVPAWTTVTRGDPKNDPALKYISYPYGVPWPQTTTQVVPVSDTPPQSGSSGFYETNESETTDDWTWSEPQTRQAPRTQSGRWSDDQTRGQPVETTRRSRQVTRTQNQFDEADDFGRSGRTHRPSDQGGFQQGGQADQGGFGQDEPGQRDQFGQGEPGNHGGFGQGRQTQRQRDFDRGHDTFDPADDDDFGTPGQRHATAKTRWVEADPDEPVESFSDGGRRGYTESRTGDDFDRYESDEFGTPGSTGRTYLAATPDDSFGSTGSGTGGRPARCHIPFVVKLFVPTCWFVDDEPTGTPGASTAAYTGTGEPGFEGDINRCTPPLLIKALAAPCWFIDPDLGGTPRPMNSVVHQTNTKLASMNGVDTQTRGRTTCPSPFKYFVPPCWFMDEEPVGGTTRVQTAGFNEGGDGYNRCDVPLLFKPIIAPCWFIDPDLGATPQPLNEAVHQTNARLVSIQEGGPTTGQAQTRTSCPSPFKFFVPPCWFVGD